jgi:uncharacterized protein YjaZ
MPFAFCVRMRLLLVLLGTLLPTLLACPVYAGAQALEVTVVPVYEGMASYAETVDANPNADRRALWQEKVVDPYWQRCAAGGEYIDYAPPLKAPFTDIVSLRAAAAALRSSSIESVVRSAVQKSESVLPGPATTVCVLAADANWTYLQDMHGVGGFTAGAGKIWLTILPGGDWKDWITHGVAHEYHHSVWTARFHNKNPILNVADYLVFEGRADSFANIIDPLRHSPWTNALTRQQERTARRTIERRLQSTDAQLMQGLMFGGAEGVPHWAGYTIGFQIVQSFLKAHPDLNVSQWTAIPANELLQQSSYLPEP